MPNPHQQTTHGKGPTALVLLAIGSLIGPGCDREPSSNAGANAARNVLSVWAHHGQPAENEALRAIVAAFNVAHVSEGLQAEITFFPDRQYNDKVQMAAVAGNLPDVLDIDGPYVAVWAEDGLLHPLDAYVSDELRADFLPSILTQGTHNGRLFALGAFESALVLYYNRDITRAAGLDPPERFADAWTWDEFLTALDQVKPHADLPLSLHMDERADEWFTYAFSPLLWSNGGRLIAPDGRTVQGVLDDPRNVVALSQWQELFQREFAQASSADPNPFADPSKRVAFDWTGHWMLSAFEQVEGLNFGVTPLPTFGDQRAAACGSWCWGVSAQAAEPDQAWKLLRWLVHPEHGVAPIVRANGAVPARRSAFAALPEYEQMPRRLFREQLESAARPRPRTPLYPTLTREFARAVRDIAGGASVAESLSNAADAVQSVADRRRR